jgi:hypothetical protein
LRLTVVGGAEDQRIDVSWSDLQKDRGWSDTTWRRVRGGVDEAEFKSEARVWFLMGSDYFITRTGWYFEPAAHVMVISVGERRLRFEPGSIFGEFHDGPPPREVMATFDITDYLTGAKQPLPLEWPADRPSRLESR